MKKSFIILLLIPFLAFKSSPSNKDFIGKWTGEDANKIGYITFDSEGYAAFEIDGQVMGGKEFELNGEKGNMIYTINDTTDPIEVDLILTKFNTGEKKTMLCIAKFEGTDTMYFAMGFDSARPTNFEADETLLLKRVK